MVNYSPETKKSNMDIDIDWFEGYFEAKTREDKIKWLKEQVLYYDKGNDGGASFALRAHHFYGILSQKLQQLNSFEELKINK